MNAKELLYEIGVDGSLAEVHSQLNTKIKEIDWKLLGDTLVFQTLYVKADVLYNVEKNGLLALIALEKEGTLK